MSVSGEVPSPLYRALFETAPDAMIVVARDGRIVLANPQAARLFGYALEELAGQPVELLMPEQVRGRHHAHRTGYMERPRERPMGAGQELVGRRRDGGQFPVEIALSPINSGTETLFAASIRDISETLRQRQALARARFDTYAAQIGQLALQTGDFEKLGEKISVLMRDALQARAVGIVLFQSPHARMLGNAVDGTDEDIVEKVCAALDLGPGNCPAEPDVWLRDAAHAAVWSRAGIGGGRILPILDHDRTLGALIVLSSAPWRADRDTDHFLSMVTNVLATAALRHHAQEQLAHSQRLEAVGHLTGGIAHDFNNLLTIVSGNLQLLEDLAERDPVANDAVTRALRAVGRGAELTRKLLAFARRQRLSPDAVAPADLLLELGRMLERTLGETIQVQIDCPAELPAVFADPVQLEGALLNLALNARDAMPRGGRLSISARQHRIEETGEGAELPVGRYVRFTIADTGVGMPPDVLARAFEPFFTTKESGKGSGLGLSMVYGFVKQSGGQLLAQSQLGYGTQMNLILPLAPSGAVRPETVQTMPGPRGNQTVLVVEDEPEVRGIAVAFLRALGYAVHEAGDAEQALQHLRDDSSIALLFSDVVLGGSTNGIELAHAARALRPTLPVLLTSGYELGSTDTPHEFPLLRKPYRREELASASHAALRRS
ncbi:PAS domain S-box-containing protein [Tahibacter aquaticus]|uniref:histidine kinase n=1 Tax=Tahibacter aquaticus TaxID=520092 RepID=A0A4V3DLV4_9GAMM|nr:PAS domain S-box protein [Tahibacter aquaticus]TDR41582.1 PAS domain S-box-containing protein [Tahibacter aquaticus]